MKSKALKLMLTAAFAAVSMSATWAVPITISEGFPGNAGTDNVLFNDGSLSHSGLLVQGNFSGGGTGFIVDFTSTGGNLVGGGGQAEITGGAGNDPFTNLKLQLEDGATFTKAILNPLATVDGTIEFTVSYIDAGGSPHVETFPLSGSGQNFFNIEAGDDAKITSIELNAIDTAFESVRQIRLGGFAPGDDTPPPSVPDGGATAILLGLGVFGLAVARRKN